MKQYVRTTCTHCGADIWTPVGVTGRCPGCGQSTVYYNPRWYQGYLDVRPKRLRLAGTA